MKKLLVALFLCLALFSRAQAELQCMLADPIVLDDDGLVEMEQVQNKEAGTFTMRFTYYGGQSWIGIGINQDGDTHMTPATAVIGRMLNGAPSVLKYDLSSDAKDASGVIPMDGGLQNLQDATFTQTDTESVLEFTQELNDVTQQVSDNSMWIYAVGLPDNAWEGKHKIHGAFTITLYDDCVDVPVPAPADPPAVSPTVATQVTPTVMEPNDTTSGGDESESSSEEGGNVSSGNPDSSQSGIVTFQNSAEATRPLWIAHGFLMAIAWGIFAPLAIGAVLLRHVSFLAEGGRWYKIHFYLNIANILFTFIGFFLAVAATNQEDDEHFTEETHKKAGLAIFIIVLFQFVAAFFRPSPPKATPQVVKSVEHPSTPLTDNGDNSSPDHSVDHAVNIDSEAGSDGFEIEEDSVTHSVEQKQSTTKSKARSAWEISHRFLGVTLIGLAWYNCYSGIELQTDKYDENDDLTAVFWGVTGGIAGLIFCLAYVVRV